MTVEEARVRLPAGYALSPKPLCLVCHDQGDAVGRRLTSRNATASVR